MRTKHHTSFLVYVPATLLQRFDAALMQQAPKRWGYCPRPDRSRKVRELIEAYVKG